MRALRNITIIALLALIIDVVPGGGNAASAIVTAFSLIFMVLVGFAGLQLYRQYRLATSGFRSASARSSSARSGRSCR